MRNNDEDRHIEPDRGDQHQRSPVNHERGADSRRSQARALPGGASSAAPARRPGCEAEAHDEDAQRDLFLRGHRQESEEPEQPPAALLAEVKRKEQQGGGQRNRVELPHVGCLQPGKQQIDRRKGDTSQMAVQAVACQPENGQRA